MRTFLISLILALASSCVTPARFDALEYRFTASVQEQEDILIELSDNQIDADEATARIAEVQRDWNVEVEEFIADAYQVPQVVAGQVLNGVAQIGTGDVLGGVSSIALIMAMLYAKTKKDAIAQVHQDREREHRVPRT